MGSLVFLFLFGLKPGIDFTGGSILEVEFQAERPSTKDLREKLNQFDLVILIRESLNNKSINSSFLLSIAILSGSGIKYILNP